MSRLTRRQFVQASAAGAVTSGFFVNPAPAAPKDSPNERLNIAAVGTSNRAGANIQGVASQNIVALADVDSRFLDAAANRYRGQRRHRRTDGRSAGLARASRRVPRPRHAVHAHTSVACRGLHRSAIRGHLGVDRAALAAIAATRRSSPGHPPSAARRTAQRSPRTPRPESSPRHRPCRAPRP